MSGLPRMVCRGCGARLPEDEPFPFRCPNRGRDDGDHVLRRTLPRSAGFPAGDEPNPFVRYRGLAFAWHRARAGGLPDADYVALVEELDSAIARVDGRGFAETPFGRDPALSAGLGLAEPGGVWVKDESGGVAGSHKARHLMGILLYLKVLDHLGSSSERELAIASCGNAALAAAVLASAAAERLRAFVPEDADPRVLDRLGELGAETVVCPRRPGERGDPCYHRFQEAVAAGALPFCCQGPDNGMCIEGAQTLAYEMVARLEAPLDALVVQVGGGALATACIRGLEEAAGLRALASLPRLYAVQTEGAHPLARAHDLLAARIDGPAAIPGALEHAARNRSRFMWPWESRPESCATGILDDETYDWLAVVEAMLGSGGGPVVVGEAELEAARGLAGPGADATGAAGLAGLARLLREGRVRRTERVGVILTGRAS